MTKKIFHLVIICSVLLPTIAFGATLQEIILRVTTEIDVKIENLNKAIVRIESLKRISDSQRIEISDPLKTLITDLTALKTKVSQETNMPEALADFKLVTQSYRVYALVMPRTSIMLAGERVNHTAALLKNTKLKVQERLDKLPSGADVLAIDQLLADFDVKVFDANANVETAVDEISPLSSDNGNLTIMSTNLATLNDARSKIILSHQAIKDARKDLGDAIQLIREIENK